MTPLRQPGTSSCSSGESEDGAGEPVDGPSLARRRGAMSPGADLIGACAELRAASRRWLALSLLVLVLAGLFALAVVVGRMPPFDRFVTDPVFFKRCLVAHVNLALVAWFYSIAAALFFLLPARGRAGWLARHSVHVAGAGIAMQLFGAGIPGAAPLLSNYIPTVDHWLFQAGQLLFGAGVLASFADPRLLPGGARIVVVPMPKGVESGLRATLLALLLASLTFAFTWLRAPSGLSPDVFADLLVWGVGHVLQLACTLAMLSLWLWLLESVIGEPPVSEAASRWLFAALLLPWVSAPLFALAGTSSAGYQVGFTELMRWCIAPVVTIFLILSLGAVVRAWKAGTLSAASLADARLSAFLVSGALTVLGFALGASIRGQSTVVPAHYHASVGAITVSFMAATYLVLPLLGLRLPGAWLVRTRTWQPLVYGTGMLVFAAGFALAGAHGMGRKIYGAEQAARGTAETLGLGMMGVGGFAAIAGGIMFLAVAGAAWIHRVRVGPASEALAASRRLEYGAEGPG